MSFFGKLVHRKSSRDVSLRTIFFIPALLLIVVFLAFPVLQTAYLSFVFHPRVSLTLGENSRDTYLGETDDAGVRFLDPDTNYDAGEDPEGGFGVNDTAFLWMRFDISAIPGSANIEAVTLYLFSTFHDETGERKRLAVAGVRNSTAANNWEEATITWNTFDGSSPWTGGSDGGEGDRDEVFRILGIETSDIDDYYSFRFNKDGVVYVQERSGGVVSLQVYGLNPGHERRFVLSEGLDGERPYLEVVYEEAGEAIGLQNYNEVLTSRDTINLEDAPWPPLGTLIHNFIWIAIHLPVTLFAGLFLAIILKDMRGASFIKGAIFLGMVTPLIVGGMILRFIFTQDAGLVPSLFGALGIDRVVLGGREICLVCTLTLQTETLLFGLIFGSVWLWTGFSLIVFSAGLTTIPKDYFEAAKIDGASPFQIFRRITFPLLRPITMVVITMTVLYELKIFDIVIASTNASGGVAGAADVLALQMYRYAFVALPFEPNLAAVVATLLTFLTLFATIWTIRYMVGTKSTRRPGRSAISRALVKLREALRR